MAPIRLLAICLALATAGCSQATRSTEDAGADPQVDPCAALPDSSWQSVTEGECGLGPGGPVLCHWSVRFDAHGAFDWSYSDVVEAGTYTCEDGEIAAQAGSSRTITGRIDATARALVWDGVDYEPAPTH